MRELGWDGEGAKRSAQQATTNLEVKFLTDVPKA
jgi:hypothetical protein